jgi:chloramphenicol 3-O phosphotransferase
MATVIVLNGTSSSGKTTIARALQNVLAPRIFLNFSIDSILYTLPPAILERLGRGDHDAALDVPALVRAYYGCVRELLAQRHDLVIDNAVTSSSRAALLHEAVAGHDALIVGLTCDAATLEARERQRGDREPGMAVKQARTIHDWLRYDLMIDTAALSPEEAAGRIVAALQPPG